MSYMLKFPTIFWFCEETGRSSLHTGHQMAGINCRLQTEGLGEGWLRLSSFMCDISVMSSSRMFVWLDTGYKPHRFAEPTLYLNLLSLLHVFNLASYYDLVYFVCLHFTYLAVKCPLSCEVDVFLTHVCVMNDLTVSASITAFLFETAS